jgi:hypothetical protein
MAHKYRSYYVVQHATNHAAPDASARHFDSSLSAFIIYENVATGKRAKELCDVLASSLSLDCEIEIELFSFESLHVPRMRRLAAAAATHASLIVFSCLGRHLPLEVWKWTELCLKRPDQPTALVALLAGALCQTGPPQALETYLAGLAHRRGMQFFPNRHSSAAGAAIGQLRPVLQKEPNDTSSCATVFRDHYPRELYPQ